MVRVCGIMPLLNSNQRKKSEKLESTRKNRNTHHTKSIPRHDTPNNALISSSVITGRPKGPAFLTSDWDEGDVVLCSVVHGCHVGGNEVYNIAAV